MGLTFAGNQALYLPFGTINDDDTIINKFPCSFGCWFNPSSFPAYVYPGPCVMGTSPTATFPNSWLRLFLDAAILSANMGIATQWNASWPSNLVAGTWYHILAAYANAHSVTLYFNGVSINVPTTNNSAGGFPEGQNTFCIGVTFDGVSSPDTATYIHGEISYPAAWNGVALTQADATALYNGGSGSDPRAIESSYLVSFLLMQSATPYLDNISGTTWTPIGTPTYTADLFSVPLVSTPVMSVQGATLVTATTATLNGTVVLTRGATVTSKGFNYGISTSYGTSPTPLTGSFTNGAYSIAVTGLTPSTIYHFQATATNSSGVGVSTDEYFTTLSVGNPLGQPYADLRLGYSTHFDQQGGSPNYNPTTCLPLIAQSGAGWIRDDMNWQVIESVYNGGIGVYNAAQLKPFWNEAIAQGLGIVAIIAGNQGNTLYTNNYDPTGMANFCVWLVGQLPTVVIEILNEPNNNYQGYMGGTKWQSSLVTLTNTVRAAVHAVSPTTQIIGYGAQGQQILTMLGEGGLCDGIVYHPYDLNDEIPEHCYEPPYLNYDNWVRTLRSYTPVPIWETERNGCITANDGLAVSEYDQALWNARRILQTFGLGVEHTFIYEYTDGLQQSVVDYYLNPRQTTYVVQKLLLTLAGTVGTLEPVVLTNLSAGFDSGDVMTYTYRSSTATVIAVWLGNNPTNQPPTYGTATVSFPLLNTNVTAYVLDTMVGTYTPLANYSTSTVGNTLSVSGIAVTDVPKLISVSGVTVASPPIVSIIFGASNLTLTSATLSASIMFNGGSASTVTGFNYGLTTAYGLTVSTIQGLSTGNFSNNVSGLVSGVQYHVQAFATNATGMGVSPDFTFFTNPAVIPPTPPAPPIYPLLLMELNPTITDTDVLIESIIRESKTTVALKEAEELTVELDTNVHGAANDHRPPPEYQNEYLKLYEQADYRYRV